MKGRMKEKLSSANESKGEKLIEQRKRGGASDRNYSKPKKKKKSQRPGFKKGISMNTILWNRGSGKGTSRLVNSAYPIGVEIARRTKWRDHVKARHLKKGAATPCAG